MSTYTIADYDLQEIARQGSGSIHVRVVGFWSRETITLYIHRQWGRTDAEWAITVSRSSGGRDVKELADEFQATRNYAEALSAVANLGEWISKQTSQMELWYKAERAIEREEERKASEAAKAKVEQDAVLGDDKARGLVQSIAKGDNMIKAFRRGSEWAIPVKAKVRNKTKFYMGETVIAREALISQLALMSHRTTLAY